MSAPDPDCQILITRVFDAPRALVFKAWTQPKHIMRWWLPAGFTSRSCEVDLRVGGMFRLEMQAPDGTLHPCDGIYEEIIEPERIVYLGMPDDRHACGAGLPPHGRVTVTFVEQGKQTRLTIRASLQSAAAREAAMAMGFDTSWNVGLDKLAELLATQNN